MSKHNKSPRSANEIAYKYLHLRKQVEFLSSFLPVEIAKLIWYYLVLPGDSRSKLGLVKTIPTRTHFISIDELGNNIMELSWKEEIFKINFQQREPDEVLGFFVKSWTWDWPIEGMNEEPKWILPGNLAEGVLCDVFFGSRLWLRCWHTGKISKIALLPDSKVFEGLCWLDKSRFVVYKCWKFYIVETQDLHCQELHSWDAAFAWRTGRGVSLHAELLDPNHWRVFVLRDAKGGKYYGPVDMMWFEILRTDQWEVTRQKFLSLPKDLNWISYPLSAVWLLVKDVPRKHVSFPVSRGVNGIRQMHCIDVLTFEETAISFGVSEKDPILSMEGEARWIGPDAVAVQSRHRGVYFLEAV